jgi:hypothetical protein
LPRDDDERQEDQTRILRQDQGLPRDDDGQEDRTRRRRRRAAPYQLEKAHHFGRRFELPGVREPVNTINTEFQR